MEGIILCHRAKIGRCFMKMKPKSTVKNARAMLYKRYIELETSNSLAKIYRTGGTALEYRYWYFNGDIADFIEMTYADVPSSATIIDTGINVYVYKNKYYRYGGTPGVYPPTLAWVKYDTNPSQLTPIGMKVNTIGKYQLNKYYYVASFDFIIKGSIGGTTTQYIKGNIAPLTSFDIKHFNDNINLQPDDLVVINGRLYSVENPEEDHKHQPKDYKIYYATLNSIL